jgi:hypothetical protein
MRIIIDKGVRSSNDECDPDCDCDCACASSHSLYIVYFECGHSATSRNPIVDETVMLCPTCKTEQKILASRLAGNGVPAKPAPQLAAVRRQSEHLDHILTKLGGRVETE